MQKKKLLYKKSIIKNDLRFFVNKKNNSIIEKLKLLHKNI